MAPSIVVVEVFVALAQPIHPLSKQVQRGMSAAALIAGVMQALGHALRKTDLPIDLPQQQHAGIAGHVAPSNFTSTRRRPTGANSSICPVQSVTAESPLNSASAIEF